jgi:archaemetzincin
MIMKIVTVGSLDPTIIEYLTQLISKRFKVMIQYRSSVPINAFEEDKSRGQYLSKDILEVLARMRGSDDDALLGIAAVDLYIPSLNFVFGQADPASMVAVISVTRLRPSFYGLQDDDRVLHLSAGKEAVHELGHLFRLKHCVNPRCVMFFSKNVQKV